MKIRPNFELFKQGRTFSVVCKINLLTCLFTVGSQGQELREEETTSTQALTTIVVAAHFRAALLGLFGFLIWIANLAELKKD